jgi:hypothetical protein
VWVVEWGGEGIVLKDRRSAYKPGTRSASWWKVKHKLVLPVDVVRRAPELVAWGDWGRACMMEFAYQDPRSDRRVTVEQAVRVPVPERWTGTHGGTVLGRAAERGYSGIRSWWGTGR